MIKMNKLLLTAAAAGIMFCATPSYADDVAAYKALATETIQSVVGGEVSDVDALLAKQDELIALGVTIAKDVAARHPEGATMLEFTISHVDEMKNASLDAIEDEWHHGGAYGKNGLPHDEFDHYGPIIGAKDAIVHPVTAYAALKAYAADHNEEHLETIQEELEEILGQVEYVTQ